MSELLVRVQRLNPTVRFRWINILLLAAIVGIAAFAVVELRSTATSAAQAPRTVTASRGVVLSTVSATGNVAAPTQLSVGFQTSGRIVAIGVTPGQHVKKGQVLGRLDAATARVSVVNAGIGGNQVIGPAEYSPQKPFAGGPSALVRLERDVLSLSGVSTVIWLEGINDFSKNGNASAEAVQAGMKEGVAQSFDRMAEYLATLA